MTATIGINLRVPADLHAALETIAPRGEKTKFILALLRRELQRRGALPADNAGKPTARKGTR